MSDSNALFVLDEVDELAAAVHRETWHAFDEPERWLMEQMLTIVEAQGTLRGLTAGTCHAGSAEKLCAKLDVVERLIDHVRQQVDESRIRAAREAQNAVYREARDAS